MNFRLAAFLILGLVLGSPAQAAPACTSLSHAASAHQPQFLASYPELTLSQLKEVAFLYDNAVAAIALAACGESAKARSIGDAVLWALDHDRYWHDGRLRNGYPAGPMTDAPVKLPGWWDNGQKKWVEDQYQVGSDTGNLAWAMLALAALYRDSSDARYLAGAERIGAWLQSAFDRRSPAGFDGGTFGDGAAPARNRWKSTEHNVDLAAAYAQLAEITGDRRWTLLSLRARRFVNAMWDRNCSCFAAGTGEDGKSPNQFMVLDAQIWPLLALPGMGAHHPGDFDAARRTLAAKGGFAYSQGSDGVWTEGTAQAALLVALSGQDPARLFKAIARNRAPGGGYYASSAQQSGTGFMLQTDPAQPRLYFRTPHLGALAWVALAQQRFNPFTGTHALPGG